MCAPSNTRRPRSLDMWQHTSFLDKTLCLFFDDDDDVFPPMMTYFCAFSMWIVFFYRVRHREEQDRLPRRGIYIPHGGGGQCSCRKKYLIGEGGSCVKPNPPFSNKQNKKKTAFSRFQPRCVEADIFHQGALGTIVPSNRVFLYNRKSASSHMSVFFIFPVHTTVRSICPLR